MVVSTITTGRPATVASATTSEPGGSESRQDASTGAGAFAASADPVEADPPAALPSSAGAMSIVASAMVVTVWAPRAASSADRSALTSATSPSCRIAGFGGTSWLPGDAVAASGATASAVRSVESCWSELASEPEALVAMSSELPRCCVASPMPSPTTSTSPAAAAHRCAARRRRCRRGSSDTTGASGAVVGVSVVSSAPSAGRSSKAASAAAMWAARTDVAGAGTSRSRPTSSSSWSDVMSGSGDESLGPPEPRGSGWSVMVLPM